MPAGYYTIEERRGAKWVPVCHLEGYGKRLTDALKRLEERGKPGFYRIVQMQRMVLAEKVDGRLHLKKWHASGPKELERCARAFCGPRKRAG